MNGEACPECRGHGVYGAFYSFTGGEGGYQVRGCPTCKGTGEVPAGTAARVAFGEEVRAARVAARLKLRDVAPHLGLSPAGLSAIEFGRREWKP